MKYSCRIESKITIHTKYSVCKKDLEQIFTISSRVIYTIVYEVNYLLLLLYVLQIGLITLYKIMHENSSQT